MNKRLDFFFDRGMATPLLLPKLEWPAILDAVEVQLVLAPEQIELGNSLVCEHHYLKSANLVGEQLRYVLIKANGWLSWDGPPRLFTSKIVKRGRDGPLSSAVRAFIC